MNPPRSPASRALRIGLLLLVCCSAAPLRAEQFGLFTCEMTDNTVRITDFADAAPGFTAYYFRGSIGFTSPTWNGYPSVMIDRAVHPAAEWLLGYGLPWDADPQDDLHGDGVSLLLACALNLDPSLNQRASLPAPLLDAQTLSTSFCGASPGINFAVETSTDLVHRTTAGVILCAPGADGRRTASITRDGPARYLRVKVTN